MITNEDYLSVVKIHVAQLVGTFWAERSDDTDNDWYKESKEAESNIMDFITYNPFKANPTLTNEAAFDDLSAHLETLKELIKKSKELVPVLLPLWNPYYACLVPETSLIEMVEASQQEGYWCILLRHNKIYYPSYIFKRDISDDTLAELALRFTDIFSRYQKYHDYAKAEYADLEEIRGE